MWPLSLYREGGCVCVCFEILYFVMRKIPTSRLSMSSLRYLFLGYFFLFIKFNLKFFLWFSLRIVLYSNAQKNMVIKSILLISYLIRRLHTKKLSTLCHRKHDARLLLCCWDSLWQRNNFKVIFIYDSETNSAQLSGWS